MLAPLEYGGFQLPLKGEDSMRVGYQLLVFEGLFQQASLDPFNRVMHDGTVEDVKMRFGLELGREVVGQSERVAKCRRHYGEVACRI